MHWQAWLHKFTRKVLFSENTPLPTTKERVSIFIVSHIKAIEHRLWSGCTGFPIRSHPGANKFQRHFQALLTAKMVFQILFIFIQMPLGSVWKITYLMQLPIFGWLNDDWQVSKTGFRESGSKFCTLLTGCSACKLCEVDNFFLIDTKKYTKVD